MMGQETYVIRDAEAAFAKFNEVLNSSEKEILIMTSPKGVINAWKNQVLRKKSKEKGVSIKVVAPITSENLRAARELQNYCSVKHVPACHARATVIDGKHLFQFKLIQEKLAGVQHFENTIFSGNLEFVQRARSILDEIWRGAFDISNVVVGSLSRTAVPTVFPSTHVSDVAKIMHEQNIGAVIVVKDLSPLGIITERDII
jgi:hypothetical protein